MKLQSQQNYNVPQKAFAARLDLEAATGMIEKSEIKLLGDIAAKIGAPTDSIKVSIGKTSEWPEGGIFAGDVRNGYPMKLITVIKGKIKDKDLSQEESVFGRDLRKPFEILKSQLKTLAIKTNPGFRKEFEAKIEVLKQNLLSVNEANEHLSALKKKLESSIEILQCEIEILQREIEI